MEELIKGIKEADSIVVTGSIFSICFSDHDVDHDCSKLCFNDTNGNEIFINVTKVTQLETDSSEKRYEIFDEINDARIIIDLF